MKVHHPKLKPGLKKAAARKNGTLYDGVEQRVLPLNVFVPGMSATEGMMRLIGTTMDKYFSKKRSSRKKEDLCGLAA